MWGGLKQVRLGEGRDTLVAAVSLFTLLGAHALLETARDALFLSHIAASRLPFVYIGVAIAALGVATLQRRGPGGRSALTGWLVLSAAITASFSLLVGRGIWVLYALYIWSAVVVTVGLTRFFMLLGERFTVSQAKRLYSLIGAGSVLGAIAGSGLAGVLAKHISAHALLLVGAGALLLAAVGPLALSGGAGGEPEPIALTDDKPTAFSSARSTFSDPYARRVALLMIASTITFTLVDYVFKSDVANSVPAAELGYFFGRVYFVLNVASLGVQLLVVPRLVKVCGPTRSLALLPLMLALGGVGVVLGGGLIAGLALKGADGAFRHSLHRTASELLYVPMTQAQRAASKTFIDIIGHRGGQALASVVILGLAAAGAEARYFGVGILLLSVAMFVIAVELRKHYLDVFRGTLASVAGHGPAEFPELSLASLESLIATLNSSDDRRVEVALDLFAEQERSHLIPGLILYHPSPDVLAKALELLAETNRRDFLPLADRLLDHEYAHVRAAALRARMKLSPDEELLRRKLEVTCPVVRATALVGLTAGGYASLKETRPFLDSVLTEGSDVAKEALARAIGYGPVAEFNEYLVRLAASDDDAILLSVARSMGQAPNPLFVPALIQMLARRAVRDEACRTLVAVGEPALTALDEALGDDSLASEIRRQLPRTIGMFEPSRATALLSARLKTVNSGSVRYRILRTLNRLTRENPDLGIPRDALSFAVEDTVAEAYRLLDWRLTLESEAEAEPSRRTVAHQLLVRMLVDKEANTHERMFRLLSVLNPRQDLRAMARGLASDRADVAASSRELLESLLPSRWRDPVMGLLDDVPDAARLRSAGQFYQPAGADYESVLEAMRGSDSDSLLSLAEYLLDELRVQESAA